MRFFECKYYLQLWLPYCIIPKYHESLAFDWTCMLILFYRYEWNRKYSPESVLCRPAQVTMATISGPSFLNQVGRIPSNERSEWPGRLHCRAVSNANDHPRRSGTELILRLHGFMGDRLYVFDTDLFLYTAMNFELDDVLIPVPFIPTFGNDFFGAGCHFVIDTGGAYMC